MVAAQHGDDAPFGDRAPLRHHPYCSLDRKAEHPSRHPARYGGILQAEAYAGFDGL